MHAPSGPMRQEFATAARSVISCGAPADTQLAGGQQESQQASSTTCFPVAFRPSCSHEACQSNSRKQHSRRCGYCWRACREIPVLCDRRGARRRSFRIGWRAVAFTQKIICQMPWLLHRSSFVKGKAPFISANESFFNGNHTRNPSCVPESTTMSEAPGIRVVAGIRWEFTSPPRAVGRPPARG